MRKIKLHQILIKNKIGDTMGNSRKLKVLLVHNFYQVPGGEDTVFVNEKKLLEDNDHEIFTYTKKNEEINDFNLWRKLCYPITSIFSLKTYKEVKRVILDNKIDVVHVHNTWPLISPSVYYAAFHSKVPVVQTIHNFRLICPGGTLYHNGKICEDSLYKGLRSSLKLKIYKGSFIHTLISAATLKIHRVIGTYKKVNFIFLTEFNKNKILELNNNGRIIIDTRKTYIKPNFVNIDNRKVIPFDRRKNQFVFAGRLDKIKGIDFLLEAWKQIKDIDLIICGTGPAEDWCKNYISENKLTNIKMMGFIDNKKTRDIIAESKALILPTQWYEGFPMTIVESYSVGTPVIGSDIGNVGNLVEDGATGMRFKYNSIESLCDVIKYHKDMIDTTRMYYDKNLAVDKNYLALLDIYIQCIDTAVR